MSKLIPVGQQAAAADSNLVRTFTGALNPFRHDDAHLRGARPAHEMKL